MERSEGVLCVVQSKKRESTIMTLVKNETEKGIKTKNEFDVMKKSERNKAVAGTRVSCNFILASLHSLSLSLINLPSLPGGRRLVIDEKKKNRKKSMKERM
jgi:hypothetical protein